MLLLCWDWIGTGKQSIPCPAVILFFWWGSLVIRLLDLAAGLIAG